MIARTGAARRPLARGPWYALVVALAFVPLAPLLVMDFIPTTDGPAHVLEGYVLGHYGVPEADYLVDHYVFSAAPSPNLLMEVVLAVLLRVLSPTVTERVVAVSEVVLFASALTFAVRSASAASTWLALLGAPLATGYLFFLGFYNFTVGTALALLTIGLYVRHRKSWTWRSSALLVLLLLLTVSAHLLPFLMTAGFVGVSIALDLIATARSKQKASKPGSAGRLRPAGRRRILVPLAALVPPIALSLVFLLRAPEVRSDNTAGGSISQALGAFGARTLPDYALGQVAVFTRNERVLGVLLVAAIALLVATALLASPARLVQRPAMDLVVMAVLSCLSVALIPDLVGTLQYIHTRFVLFAMLFVLVALAGVPELNRWKVPGIAVAVLVTVGLAIVRIPAQLELNEDLLEYGSVVGQVPASSTFVAWLVSTAPSAVAPGLDPLLHNSDRVAAGSRSVNLNHLDGRYSYFPAQFRDLGNLGTRATDLVQPRDWVAFLADAERMQSRPDLILVWGRLRVAPAKQADPDYARAFRALRKNYERTWVSRPDGMLELYRRCPAAQCVGR